MKTLASIPTSYFFNKTSVFTSGAFHQDAAAVAGLSHEQLDATLSVIDALDGLPGKQSIVEAVQRKVQIDIDTVRRVVNFLFNMNELRGDSDPQEFIKEIMPSIKINAQVPLDEGRVKRLSELLPKTLKKRELFLTLSKARALESRTGLELVESHIVCDMRPVFDHNRDEIKAAVPITTMRIAVADDAGRPTFLDIRLTHDDLEHLLKQAETAKKKHDAILCFLKKNGIHTPGWRS